MKISRMEWAAAAPGIERLKAFFHGHAFTPHRHDTYAIGVTVVGVQSFDYRGETRHSLPGQVFVLHPDERHDGRSGDGRGFGYRSAFIDPALIHDAAATKALPFIRDPVCADRRLRSAVLRVIAWDEEPADELNATCNLVTLTDALARLARHRPLARGSVDAKAVGVVRDALLARLDARVAIGELETLCGLTRWELARQFRRAFGVSPYRYHVLRRLDRARALLGRGHPLAEVAELSGFADQAHFSRHFRSAYGLSPGEWRSATARKPIP